MHAPGVVAVDPSISGKVHAPLVALVDRQWGVVSRRQLLALGVAGGTVDAWLATGRLRPIHRGVFAYGHAHLRVEGRWLAAVLACGPRAALAGRSAAAALDLLPYASATVHVICERALRPRPGVRPHRTRSLVAHEVTDVHGVPTTTVARTALDVAASEPRPRLERLLAQADRLGIYDLRALEAVIDRHPGHHGAGALSALIAAVPLLTRSELEALLLEVARAHGVGPPISDHPIHLPRGGPITVDFAFPGARLIVEADSWQHHRSRASFESDRARDLELTALGYRVARLTDRMLRGEPREILTLVASLLGSS